MAMRAAAGLALLALGSANYASLHNSAAASRRLQSGACADLDGSGIVDVTDLLALLAAFGTSNAGDTDGDGVTNVTGKLSAPTFARSASRASLLRRETAVTPRLEGCGPHGQP